MPDSTRNNIPNYEVACAYIKGITSCIANYTDEPMITESCNALLAAVESGDAPTAIHFLEDISEWYARKIDKICSDSWVSNRDEHKKNLDLLPKLIRAFEQNGEWFKSEYPVQTAIGQAAQKRRKMVFVSHSSLDAEYVEALVVLLRKLGLTDENLFCSSYPGYGIPLGNDIYDFLKRCFTNYELFVIFVISGQHYYNSPASLNEMGAAWVQGVESLPILLPGMAPSMLKGVVQPGSLSLVLDSAEASYRLNDLKNRVLRFLGLPDVNQSTWEHDKKAFLKKCSEIVPAKQPELKTNNVASFLNDLIEETASLEKTLYRVLGEAQKRNQGEIATWARMEIEGYAGKEELPEYRIGKSYEFTYSGFNGVAQINNAPLSIGLIDEDILEEISEIKIADPVTRVEQLASSEETGRNCTILAGNVEKNTDGLIRCTRITMKISPALFQSVCANVKTKLVDILSAWTRE